LVILLRILAAALAILGVAPLWRMLYDRPTGLAGVATAAQATAHSSVLWNGLLLCAVPGLLAALLIDRAAFEALIDRATAPLRKPRVSVFASVLAMVAITLAAAISWFVMGGVPTLIDSFAQLLQARYFADGTLSGPLSSNAEFWHIQQTVLTEHGWVSQYPPGHIVLLALGMKLGAVWLIGPLCWGIAVFFATLTLHELVPRTTVARAAALLAACSPFGLALSGAFMSHVPAAACGAAALYCVARARTGALGWALAAGSALGMLFTMRPLTALALAVVASVVAVAQRRPLAALVAVGGALPLVLAVAWYNQKFFGSPTTFGYTAALGGQAGLGFGRDPWGNSYGMVEALAYTAAELTALSLFLFETPMPLVFLVGLYFATGKRSSGEWLLFGWCLAPVVANLFYWHHGLFMGPRMLADVGVFWAALGVVSVVELIRDLPADWRIASKYSPRTFALGTVAAAIIFGGVLMLPPRLQSYRVDRTARALLKAPALNEPSLVFVHGGWTSRIAMKLAAHGMRLDSVETALRQNSTCRVHAFADSFASGAKSSVRLDFRPRAVNLPPSVEVSPGNRIRVLRNEVLDSSCAVQVRADQGGVIDVTPLVWQGDLPGAAPRGALFVRDMGPEQNRKLIVAHNARRPMMLLPDGDSVRLVSYSIAERAIWQAVP
jgi:hypothetical protein